MTMINKVKLKMKKLIFFIFVMISYNSIAQDAKNITLIVAGQGKTIDEARTVALRSAIEQAFGTFISSKTEILNDNLIADQIVSITNGNILSYDILKENQLPDSTWTTMINTQVSINNLVSFYEAKGIKVEFRGGLFAQNIAIQELNKKSEKIAWENTKIIIQKLIQNCFDYNLSLSDPKLVYEDKYSIPLIIDVSFNKNYELLKEILNGFCNSVSMPNQEINSYKTRSDWYFRISIDKKSNTYYFRNAEVANDILNTPWSLIKSAINNFTIVNDIESYNNTKLLTKRNSMIEIDIPQNEPFVIAIYNYHLFGHYLPNTELAALSSNKIDIKYNNDSEMYILKTTNFNGNSQTIESQTLNGLFNRTFYHLLSKNSPRWQGFIDPLGQPPILNLKALGNSKSFLRLKIEETRNLFEMKKIKEYKISPTEQLN